MDQTLTLTYSGAARTSTAPWLRLEQMPVPSTALSLDDLEQMLAMVRSGQSAHGYRQPTCPVSVVAGEVRVPLTVWAWPSDPGLSYRLAFAMGTPGPVAQIEQEREFDLVIDFGRHIALPFHCRTIELVWSDLPCWDRRGRVVPRPTLTASPTLITVSAEVLGVVRVRCRAIGYAHPVTVSFAKTADAKILNLENTATAWWRDGEDIHTASLDLKYPACAADLLALCPDGRRVRERVLGEMGEDEVRMVVYYDDCTGRVLSVRPEEP